MQFHGLSDKELRISLGKLCPLLQCRSERCTKAGGLFKEVLQLSERVAPKTLIPLPTLDFSYYSNCLYGSDIFNGRFICYWRQDHEMAVSV